MRFTTTDAWLLLSILYSKNKNRTFELIDVISYGDHINHGILQYDEINDGIEKLISDDYLSYFDNRLFITEKALKLISFRLRKLFQSSFDELDEIIEKIGAVSYGSYEDKPKSSRKFFSENQYQTAVDEYMKRFS